MNKWTDKIKLFLGNTSELTEDFFEQLCDLLIEGDFGAALAMKTVEDLEARCKKEKIKTAVQTKDMLFSMLKEYLSAASAIPAAELEGTVLNVILILGVNGVGKTTSAAKLAALYKDKNKPLLAAADTFRAAAADQLKIHGERLGVRTVAHKQNADAAAVIHDALEAAYSGGYNPLIADTAGRMHTKSALIEELSKINRVIEHFTAKNNGGKILYKKFLALDATTGTNALFQAETFNNAVSIDGVILTKFDSSARGGVVFPLAVNFHVPVIFICDGEKYEDIHRFNAEEYIKTFLK
ncbi:MAG: signal recognition particle-docking protein FtsY [Spirochaetaceae bacterium]|jgi:fused signal recognition particle receptor|nr:signal recognition particle-docking protein FtsY [Spirochaetaceae bacterium]